MLAVSQRCAGQDSTSDVGFLTRLSQIETEAPGYVDTHGLGVVDQRPFGGPRDGREVVARHHLGDGIPVVVELRDDPVRRVRVAATRALAILTQAGA
jgi:hypothetical protein